MRFQGKKERNSLPVDAELVRQKHHTWEVRETDFFSTVQQGSEPSSRRRGLVSRPVREEECGDKKTSWEGVEWCLVTGNRAKMTVGTCLKCKLHPERELDGLPRAWDWGAWDPG